MSAKLLCIAAIAMNLHAAAAEDMVDLDSSPPSCTPAEKDRLATDLDPIVPAIDALPLGCAAERAPLPAPDEGEARSDARPSPPASSAPDMQPAARESPRATPGDTPAEAPLPTREERMAELEKLFDELTSGQAPASFDGHEARPASAIRLEGAAMTVLSIRPHAKVASDYTRFMHIAAFVADPEGIEPFVAGIIICPSPELAEYRVIPREKISDRLKQYGVPLDRIVMTGAHEVLVLRTKAQAQAQGDEPSADEPQEDGASKKRETAVSEGDPILILREGEFSRIEEWGTAAGEGSTGDAIEITDRKGRTFRAQIVGKGTVKPIEER